MSSNLEKKKLNVYCLFFSFQRIFKSIALNVFWCKKNTCHLGYLVLLVRKQLARSTHKTKYITPRMRNLDYRIKYESLVTFAEIELEQQKNAEVEVFSLNFHSKI